MGSNFKLHTDWNDLSNGMQYDYRYNRTREWKIIDKQNIVKVFIQNPALWPIGFLQDECLNKMIKMFLLFLNTFNIKNFHIKATCEEEVSPNSCCCNVDE